MVICFPVQFSTVQSLSCVLLFVTPWAAAHQASLSITDSWILLKLMSIESVMPSTHLILWHSLLLLLAIFPSIRVFSSESVLQIRWPKYWSFSFSISPSNEYSGLISFRTDWFGLLAVQGTLKSLLQHHSSKSSIFRCSAFLLVQLSHLSMTSGTPPLQPLKPHRFHPGRRCRQGSLPPLPVGSICCWIASTASPPFGFCPFFQPAETFVIVQMYHPTSGDLPSSGFSEPFLCQVAPACLDSGRLAGGLSPLACFGNLSSGDPSPLYRGLRWSCHSTQKSPSCPWRTQERLDTRHFCNWNHSGVPSTYPPPYVPLFCMDFCRLLGAHLLIPWAPNHPSNGPYWDLPGSNSNVCSIYNSPPSASTKTPIFVLFKPSGFFFTATVSPR